MHRFGISAAWEAGMSDRIREALQFIPATDRDTWLKMGMAIKSEAGDA